MNKLIIIFFSLTLWACQNKKEHQLVEKANSENFDWLLGNWKRINGEPNKETYENWHKTSETVYAGAGFTIQNGDTISQEIMEVKQNDGFWSFYVIPESHALQEEFVIANWEQNTFTAVNDSIDFPNKIKYWKDGELLKASVSNNEFELFFEFQKIK